jgi:hypothetical protein
MSDVLIAIVLIGAISYYFGYGLCRLLLPEDLKQYSIWLSPWMFFLFVTVILVLFTIFGVSISRVGGLITVVLAGLSTYYLYKGGLPKINWKTDLGICLVVGASILFSISPLVRRDKFLTTISMGNNDIITYATNADYLVDHTLAESFRTNVILTISNLIHDGSRWGPPIISGYFIYLSGFEGYQLAYLIQAMQFTLMIPLGYVLVSVISKSKVDYKLSIFLSLMLAFNVNILYMLYHNFAGLVYFWGILMFLMILLTSYLKDGSKSDIKYEYLISTGMALLYFSYHETALFIILPLILHGGQLLLSRGGFSRYMKKMIRIMTGLFMLAGVSVVNAIAFDFKQAFEGNPAQPVGWQLFRANLSYANPFEMLGLWSIHSFKPLPIVLAVMLSIAVVLLVIKGVSSISNKKQRSFIASFLFSFTFLLLFVGLYKGNFFDYNRIVVYSLPVIIVVFSLGINSLAKINNKFQLLGFGFVLALVLFSAYKLNKRFITERVAVDLKYTTLKEIHSLDIQEPIYTAGAFVNGVPIWRQIWTGYFIYPNIVDSTFPKKYINDSYKLRIPDQSLALLYKSDPWIKGPQVIITEKIWENDWFALGRICNNDECLTNYEDDLSQLHIGDAIFEDTLLTSGWYGHENDGRWSKGKESHLRLVTYHNNLRNLSITVQPINTPLDIIVWIDGTNIGVINLNDDWQTIKLPLPKNFSTGVHDIKVEYSHVYRPSHVFGNTDNRRLAVRFQEIYFE